ncbi:MAG: serpin family protein [Clostridia bacterium]|nr:serpin family protein [Clostridia bacterium]
MKKIVAFLLVFCLFLSGCARQKTEDAASGDVVEQQKEKGIVSLSDGVPAREVEFKEPGDDFTVAQWSFGLQLLQKANEKDRGKNLLVAPYSVASALAMTANGAAGETQSQMLEVLGGLSMEDLNGYMRLLTEKESEELKTANSVWFRDAESLTVHSDFLQKNADYYDAEIFKAPFNAETADAINDWVKENTNGMIPQIIQGIDASTMLYLINALAFEAKWSDPLDPAGKDRFEDRAVEMIAGDADRWFQIEGADGFMKTYEGGRYRFGALMPYQGSDWETFLSGIHVESLAAAVKNADPTLVQLKMPKFSYDYGINLRDALSDMGMSNAFYSADFSAMADCSEGPLYIDQVIHKTFIELDENGTRAAAVTGVQMETESVPMYEHFITLNRSFLYFIYDNETGLPVFIGAVRQLEGEELPPETPKAWELVNETDGFCEQDGACYITEDGGATESEGITREKALQIAMEEAKKEKYQYQPWESNFTAKNAKGVELKRLSNDPYPVWTPEWGLNPAVPEGLCWAVRLFDENDPLTTLYIYVDAYSGVVLGGGQLSD